ncbi:uncharacterized protein MELLADRAFT_106641 [Melampsora larici-populina 98AG31]|uniref:Uncharacterized protein n=1 Tax=Melampsora larici-populina (strain 98AG31 / pathotype 3-4-7) TaxID=747676 RepID=F4RM60_MELLP|nr:uncharacterized protein MELLADRAFT_106641 [Melampsora larici-populina 98AG31]EGG06526.1 hypothetical protein MELLADRAFT_106641 [Melampsora larici-populina 98AG31]
MRKATEHMPQTGLTVGEHIHFPTKAPVCNEHGALPKNPLLNLTWFSFTQNDDTSLLRTRKSIIGKDGLPSSPKPKPKPLCAGEGRGQYGTPNGWEEEFLLSGRLRSPEEYPQPINRTALYLIAQLLREEAFALTIMEVLVG